MERLSLRGSHRCVPLTMVFALLGLSAPQAMALHPADFPHQHVEVPNESAEEHAQEESTPEDERWVHVEPFHRYYGGVGIVGMGVLPNGTQLTEGLGAGPGFEVFAGWRFNPWIAFDFAWSTSFHATSEDEGFKIDLALMSALSGSIRIYLIEPERLEPYVAVGATLVTTSGGPQSSLSLMGVGVVGALGLDIHLNDWLTLGVKATYTGTFLDNQIDRLDHLPDYPAEATFLNLLGGATHLRLNF